MADAPVVKIGTKSYVTARATASVFEDCESEVQRFIACTGIPLGQDMGAIVTLLHRVLQTSAPTLTRDDVRAGLEAPDLAQGIAAVAWALGFERKSSGEAEGPAAST